MRLKLTCEDLLVKLASQGAPIQLRLSFNSLFSPPTVGLMSRVFANGPGD